MFIVCAWCQKEGRVGIIGQKAPFDNRAESHGMCRAHEDEQRATLNLPRAEPAHA